MIQFKTKPMSVAVGTDSLFQVVVTTENGKTIGMPFEFFNALFEPEDDEGKDWLKAIENRMNPKPFEYEIQQTVDNKGNVKFKGKGFSP